MNQKLIDNLLKNWPAKIICFTIAIFLYLFHQSTLVDRKSFNIPLTVYEDGLVIHVGELPAEVALVVRVDEKAVNTVTSSDIKASINLNSITKSGTYKVPVDLTLNKELLKIDPLEIKLKNETIKVNVERRATEFIKVVPSIVGDVAPDYEISDVQMVPSYIQIQGPESIVKEIKEIKTDRVNVSNAKSPFSTTTTLGYISPLIKILDAPEVIEATVNVSPEVVIRNFTDIPIKIINVRPNLNIDKVQPSYNIRLRGKITDFYKFNMNRYPIRVDASSIVHEGEYEIPVNLNIPKEFEVLEKSGDSIFVTVSKKEEIKEEPEVTQDNVTEDSKKAENTTSTEGVKSSEDGEKK